MIIVNYRVNQRAPRLIIPSLPIYAIPSSCLPIHPRDIPPPPHFNPFYTPFHRSTFHFLRSFRLVRWPRTRTKQCFHVSMKRDSRRWVGSLDNNFNRPLKKREKEKKGKKKREMSRRRLVIRITRRIVRDWYFYASPHPRFSKRTVIEIGRQRRPFPSRGNSIKLFQKEEK